MVYVLAKVKIYPNRKSIVKRTYVALIGLACFVAIILIINSTQNFYVCNRDVDALTIPCEYNFESMKQYVMWATVFVIAIMPIFMISMKRKKSLLILLVVLASSYSLILINSLIDKIIENYGQTSIPPTMMTLYQEWYHISEPSSLIAMGTILGLITWTIVTFRYRIMRVLQS